MKLAGVFPPILCRRQSRQVFEGTGEVILIRKAAGLRNFRNGFIGEIQQLLRTVDANTQHKLHQGGVNCATGDFTK